MAWETFYGGEFPRNGSDKTTLSVSIGRGHIIRFNMATQHALGDPEAVMLKFDRLESLIGIEPVKIGTEGSFLIKKTAANGRDRRINAASFCRNFGISIERTERFAQPTIGADGILRLDLKHTNDVSKQRTTTIPEKDS